MMDLVYLYVFKNMCRVNKRFFFRITHHAHGFVDVVCILQEEDLSGSTALMVAARNRGLAHHLQPKGHGQMAERDPGDPRWMLYV